MTRDLSGLFRGQVPAAEGGGLFGLIEGALLAVFVLTAVSGAAWFITQGSGDALAWREVHVYAARSMTGLLVLHVVTVSLHLLDFFEGLIHVRGSVARRPSATFLHAAASERHMKRNRVGAASRRKKPWRSLPS